MFRRPLRGGRPRRSHRPRAGCRQPGRPGPRRLWHVVQGSAPAGCAGQGAAQRPGSAVPRRADRRSRPGRGPRRPRPDRRAPPEGGHDLPHHPPPRGGGAPLRPRRDPEHDPAHDRPAGRAPRPAVRHDADDQDVASDPGAGERLRRLAGRRWLATGRPATYVLAVSDSETAAPAATRALVAAGADVLSIGESHHSLEDVYLELIDEDPEASPR
jgi:hypothetical protein